MPALALGVDLGGTNARAAVVNRDSGEIGAAHGESHRDCSPAAVVKVVAHAVREAARDEGREPRSFDQVGVGVAGQCLGRTGVVLCAPNLCSNDVPFGQMLETALV